MRVKLVINIRIDGARLNTVSNKRSVTVFEEPPVAVLVPILTFNPGIGFVRSVSAAEAVNDSRNMDITVSSNKPINLFLFILHSTDLFVFDQTTILLHAYFDL
ncbi:hypothetical protein D3C71_1976840 [compost metagenome]